MQHLRAAGIAGILIVLAACSTAPTASAPGGASASPAPSASVGPTATPGYVLGTLPTMALVLHDDTEVVDASGALRFTLAADARVFVVAGVASPRTLAYEVYTTEGASGTSVVQLDAGHGWIRSTAAAPTLVVTQPRCPSGDLTLADLAALAPGEQLLCFGQDPVTFTAWVPEQSGLGGDCGCQADPVWLADPIGSFILMPAEDTSPWAGARLNPDAGVTVPADPGWARIEGHFDDPAAQSATIVPRADASPENVALWTAMAPQVVVTSARMVFAITAITPIAQP